MEEMNNNTTETVVDGAQHQEPETVEKTFSQSELDSIIEKRLAKERKKFEAKLREEIDQAERMAQMSEAEKQEALFQKRVKDLEEREEAFNQQQKALQHDKMLNETKNQLVGRGLPLDFADKLMAETAEGTLANIDAFEKQWQEAINNAVDSRIKGSTPTTPLAKNNKPKDVSKMSFSEFAEYKKNN